MTTGSVVEASGLTVRFGHGHSSVTAVDHVDLDLRPGQALGLVGESGSGKSTLGRAIVGLAPVAEGRLVVDGVDMARSRRRPSRSAQLVFQDPYASLDPRMSVGESIAEGLTTRRGRAAAVGELLEQVSLDADVASALPGQLSGGQRQRVALARALAAQPSVLVADEITSALDVSVQGTILNLVRRLQQERRFALLFITHNLAVVRYVADTVAVMYCGRIVEVAETDELVGRPTHPYTRSLLATVPRLGRTAERSSPTTLDGDPPDPHAPPSGCAFHPRCPDGPATHPERSVCAESDPRVDAASRPHRAACWFAAPADGGGMTPQGAQLMNTPR